jgi:glycerate-2-kinase
LKHIYRAAIAAADPARIIQQRVRVTGRNLIVRSERGRMVDPLGESVYLLGIGKGADRAMPSLSKLFGVRLKRGICIVRDPVVRRRLPRIEILTAGHPIPDERSLRATEVCLGMLSEARAGDLVVVYLMGGTSSLLVKPAPGVTLADERAVSSLLLKSGIPIDELNVVRKHLSLVKGGGLLRYADPARVVTLAISDVIGNDPSVIGSGPTVPDPSTFADALRTLRRYGLTRRVPESVRRHLNDGLHGRVDETVKPGSGPSHRSRFALLADNRTALAAARRQAEALGFRATIVTSTLSGEACSRARELAVMLKSIAKKESRAPRCFLLGGETTVKVRGRGTGGRNQEFALACSVELADCPGIYLLSAASDGSDGPTDAAGAFVDGETLRRAKSRRLEAGRALRQNNSHGFFARLGDLYKPGPTGTNVLDFIFVIVEGTDRNKKAGSGNPKPALKKRI